MTHASIPKGEVVLYDLLKQMLCTFDRRFVDYEKFFSDDQGRMSKNLGPSGIDRDY
jgi:hypothetical protein